MHLQPKQNPSPKAAAAGTSARQRGPRCTPARTGSCTWTRALVHVCALTAIAPAAPARLSGIAPPPSASSRVQPRQLPGHGRHRTDVLRRLLRHLLVNPDSRLNLCPRAQRPRLYFLPPSATQATRGAHLTRPFRSSIPPASHQQAEPRAHPGHAQRALHTQNHLQPFCTQTARPRSRARGRPRRGTCLPQDRAAEEEEGSSSRMEP